MPLDGHSYLVSQGWGGKGTGLREGAISRPIAVTQKKNLAGLGKDRDEAFPFWDHLFSAAASAIKVCIDDSDDEGSGSDKDKDNDAKKKSKQDVKNPLALNLTTTGILSNRRPPTGRPIDSSATSPSRSCSPDPSSSTSRLTLLATAKRESAKRGLYARFFRGPVLGPEATESKLTTVREGSPKPTYNYTVVPNGDAEGGEGGGGGGGGKTTVQGMIRELAAQVEEAKGAGRKRKAVEVVVEEKVEKEKVVVVDKDEEKKKRKEEKAERKKARAERRERKAAKRAAKEAKGVKEGAKVRDSESKRSEKGKERAVEEPVPGPKSNLSKAEDEKRSKKKSKGSDDSQTKKEGKKSSKRRIAEDADAPAEALTGTPPKKKKKRKHDDSE
ncbi:hypothetical protein D9611_009436 [Ephemerocybe angulata]|uniref:G-patch domain-containing protein n=1 Tax=Ephemerocybe angulata TaxID=980116 RepID=A0A8H5ETD7_9AGAR|nr:hypothetical protein D9611_009436 [Tulosesus angulatus]